MCFVSVEQHAVNTREIGITLRYLVRIWATVLALCLVLGLVPGTAWADYDSWKEYDTREIGITLRYLVHLQFIDAVKCIIVQGSQARRQYKSNYKNHDSGESGIRRF